MIIITIKIYYYISVITITKLYKRIKKSLISYIKRYKIKILKLIFLKLLNLKNNILN